MGLRIAVLTSLYPAPETPFEGIFAARKWERVAARGHEVRVVLPLPWAPRSLARVLPAHQGRLARAPKDEVRGGIPVLRPRYGHVPSRALGNAKRFARVGVEAVLATRPDVVVCDYAWPAAAATPALAAAHVPTIVNGRGSDVLQVEAVASLAPSLREGLAAARGLTAVSQDLLDAMVRLAGEGEREVALTPNGVQTEVFFPGPRDVARDAVGEAREGRLVLVVGHLIERKNPLLALEAFRAASTPDARLAFIGRGPLEDALEARVRELGLSDRVRLLGERDPSELGDWYRAADLLLLTSSREGRPNVVLEAMSSGCPVLATDAGGTAEVVPEERMLARERDADAIGLKLAGLLADPPTEDTLLGATRSLTWDASVDALETVLYAVAPGREPTKPTVPGEPALR